MRGEFAEYIQKDVATALQKSDIVFVHLRYVLVLHGEDQKIPAVISYSNVTTLDIDPPVVRFSGLRSSLWEHLHELT